MEEFNYLQKEVNAKLATFTSSIENSELKQTVEYSILGGKRLRPILIYSLCKLIGCSNLYINNSVIMVELLHSGSLILDDMPFMDDDIIEEV